MSTNVSVEDAQAKLPDLIAGMKPGDEVVITTEGRPMARLVSVPPSKGTREFGKYRSKIKMADECSDPANSLHLSAASLWEVQIKSQQALFIASQNYACPFHSSSFAQCSATGLI